MEKKKSSVINWLLFAALSIIWGSSFILMKLGLYTTSAVVTLSAYQVAALRMLSAGLVLLPIAIKQFRKIPKEKYGAILLTGFLGSFIPAFLFCIAETKIDSALAGFLNALTPIMTILIGILFYKANFGKSRLVGVFIAFSGMAVLFLSNQDLNFQHIFYAGFVLIATICYGFNVHIAHVQLKEISATNIAATAFATLIIPALLTLIFTGYFSLPLSRPDILQSTLASSILGVVGTAGATILFYNLLKNAGSLFASMVTYGIPFVAMFWGIQSGETIGWMHAVGLGIILTGVFIANKR